MLLTEVSIMKKMIHGLFVASFLLVLQPTPAQKTID